MTLAGSGAGRMRLGETTQKRKKFEKKNLLDIIDTLLSFK